jgi:hypothetical protein
LNRSVSLSILLGFAILAGIAFLAANAVNASTRPAEHEQLLQPVSSTPAIREGPSTPASRGGVEDDTSRTGQDEQEERQRTSSDVARNPPEEEPRAEGPDFSNEGRGSMELQEECPEGTVLRVTKGGGECVSPDFEGESSFPKAAPVAISGNNVYVAWWTNDTANNNEEVMFRASTNGGQSFSDRVNLSNTTNSDSWRVEIESDAESVLVTWWEINSTDDTPVMRVSNDNGATFGPLLTLATNGTIGEVTEEGEEEEG